MKQGKVSSKQTKEQIRKWIESSIKNAKNPDPLIEIKRKRKEKSKKIARSHGLW